MSPRPAAPTPHSPRIFISYRREDAAGYARALYQYLNTKLPNLFFFDLNTIRTGDDFLVRIADAIVACDIILVVIGPTWTSVTDAGGQVRLKDSKDVVRFEVATAIERKLRVIPVLLGGARMPHAGEIPEELARVLALDATRISDQTYETDVDRLSDVLKNDLKSIDADRLEAEAEDAIQGGNWKNAERLLLQALQLDPTRSRLKRKLIEVQEKSSSFWTRRKLMFSATGLGVTAAGAYGLFRVYRSGELPKHNAPLATWRQRALDTSGGNGGFRVSLNDAGARTQVFTSAQVLTAVLEANAVLDGTDAVPPGALQIRKALEYIESARSPSSTTRSEEPGWALFEDHIHTMTDSAAWTTIANVAAAQVPKLWQDTGAATMAGRVKRDLEHMGTRQDPNGGFSPIYAVKPEFTRTYPTIMALWALVEAMATPAIRQMAGDDYDQRIQNGVKWLQSSYSDTVGWVPNPNRKGQQDIYPGLTAQTLFILQRAAKSLPGLSSAGWFTQAKTKFLQTDFKISLAWNASVQSDDQSFEGTGYTAEATSFLWYPWSVAVLWGLAQDQALSSAQRDAAIEHLGALYKRLPDLKKGLEEGGTFQLAENLFAFSFISR